ARQLIATLRDRVMTRAVADDADLRVRVFDDWFGQVVSCGLELPREPIHVVLVVVGPLAVLSALVVAGAAREVRRHVVARARALRNPVAVDVLIAAPLAPAPRQRRRVEHLPSIDWLIGLLEALGHPCVHPE